ncbi:BBK32 immunogenic protein P35 [Borrelia turicatae]|uniref:BBK32 immunogenic protein P35 n=1 Tax=Borrelia turicatae TaxID=142 RepID=UPI002ECFE0B9
MQLKKQCLFALILVSFISCDLLFDKDMQEKSAGLLDKVHSILDARNQAISNTSDKPSKLIKRSLKKIRTKRKKGTERGKVNTQELPLDNGPIAGVYAPSVNDVLVSDYMTQETLPEEERENLPVVIVSGSDSTSLNSQEEKRNTSNNPKYTIPTTISKNPSNGTKYTIIGFSGDYEYTYFSPNPIISGSNSGSMTEEDNLQYGKEYLEQLEQVKQDIEWELELIDKIKKDREQVEFQATMSTSGHSTSKNRINAKTKLNQFTKEKLIKDLKELLQDIEVAEATIENTIEDYVASTNDTPISANQSLNEAKSILQDLIQAVEKVSSTYDAYAKSTGIGFGSKFSEVEKNLKDAKGSIQKAKTIR